MKQPAWLALALFWLAVSAVRATTYYVATNGLDANAGTATNTAWRTIQHAAKTLAPGDTVLVRGVYNEVVTVGVSGTATNKVVTFQNFPGETPVVDGTGLPVAQLAYASGLFEFTFHSETPTNQFFRAEMTQ